MDLQHLRASDGTGEAVLAHVQSVRTVGSTVLDLDNVDNWNSKCVVVTGTPNANGFIATAGMTVMYGHLNAGDFIIDGYAPGYSDNGNTTTEVAIVKMTTNWADTLVDLFGTEHKDNGKHKDITADSILLNTGQDVGLDRLYANAIINGGCQIAQRVTAPNLSTTSQYGAVDRFRVHATGTAVSAGTIAQTLTPAVVSIGAALKVAGATITGTGVLIVRYRMEAKDALNFVNQAASFSCIVRQDTGSSINATIYVRKPTTTADDFSATTAIANSAAIPVANNTNVTIKFENINTDNLGDCSKGLEIEIQLACGAVTTKNFEFSSFQFNKGAKASVYQPKSFDEELRACQRYYEKSHKYDSTPSASVGVVNGAAFSPSDFCWVMGPTGPSAGNRLWGTMPFKVTKRAAPTMAYTDGAGNASRNSIGDANLALAYTNQSEAFRAIFGTTTGVQYQAAPTSNYFNILTWTADAEL